MGTFENWKSVRENRFAGVNLGTAGANDMVARFRSNLANGLESMVSEGELRLDMTVQDVLEVLKQPVTPEE